MDWVKENLMINLISPNEEKLSDQNEHFSNDILSQERIMLKFLSSFDFRIFFYPLYNI